MSPAQSAAHWQESARRRAAARPRVTLLLYSPSATSVLTASPTPAIRCQAQSPPRRYKLQVASLRPHGQGYHAGTAMTTRQDPCYTAPHAQFRRERAENTIPQGLSTHCRESRLVTSGGFLRRGFEARMVGVPCH